MLNRLLFCLSLLCLLSLSSAAFAEPGWEIYWSRTATVGSSTPLCISTSKFAKQTSCALFLAGESDQNTHQVEVEVSAAARCCWTGSIPTTISVQDYLTMPAGENGTTGQGTCFHLLAAGAKWRGHPSWRMNKTAVGWFRGLCPVKVTSGRDSLYAPCESNSDCTNYGGGNCTESPGRKSDLAGVQLNCVGDSGTPSIDIRKLKSVPAPETSIGPP